MTPRSKSMIVSPPDKFFAKLSASRTHRYAQNQSGLALYVAAARQFGLPVIIGTPTFRASLNLVRRDWAAPKRSGGSTPPRCTPISGIGPNPTPYTSPG